MVGKPELIGTKDLAKPDYGDAVPVHDDEIPVFWACGVTPQSVVCDRQPEFCITHYPGSMLVTDRRERRSGDHVIKSAAAFLTSTGVTVTATSSFWPPDANTMPSIGAISA